MIMHCTPIRLKFHTDEPFKIGFKNEQTFNAIFGSYGVGAPTPYDGAYVVTPTMEDQTLATKRRMMEQNMVVKQIPHYTTANPAGGQTMTIGGI